MSGQCDIRKAYLKRGSHCHLDDLVIGATNQTYFQRSTPPFSIIVNDAETIRFTKNKTLNSQDSGKTPALGWTRRFVKSAVTEAS
jgi:hypothetical protein